MGKNNRTAQQPGMTGYYHQLAEEAEGQIWISTAHESWPFMVDSMRGGSLDVLRAKADPDCPGRDAPQKWQALQKPQWPRRRQRPLRAQHPDYAILYEDL